MSLRGGFATKQSLFFSVVKIELPGFRARSLRKATTYSLPGLSSYDFFFVTIKTVILPEEVVELYEKRGNCEDYINEAQDECANFEWIAKNDGK